MPEEDSKASLDGEGAQGDPGSLDFWAPERTGGSCRAGERFWKKGTERSETKSVSHPQARG